MRWLTCERVDTTDGVAVLEWLASTPEAQHDQALAEARRIVDWAWRHFGDRHGPAEDGGEWDHNLQVQREADGWHAVALTLTGSERFAQACLAEFGAAADD
jgi:hypothetical protein